MARNGLQRCHVAGTNAGPVKGNTIYDIAQRAGVGIATVSRVINGSTRVAEPTRLAVQRAMAELGFRPNHAARQLAVRGPNRPRVSALMPFFSSANFYFSVSRPLSNGLAAANIDLLLHDVQDRENKNRLLDQIVQERSCDGLIVCSMGIGAERQLQLQRIGIPVVCVDYPLPGVPSITVDNRGGVEVAAAHLFSTGSNKLAMISAPHTVLAFRQREEVFREIAGADVPVQRAEGWQREDGQKAMSQLLARHRSIEAVLCVNDLLAIGAVEELRSRGRDVPGAVQVIGFDDQPLMDVIGLSTVRQPMGALGDWAALAMRDLLGHPKPGTPPGSEELPVTLIHRATTRNVAKELDRPSLKDTP